MPYLAGRVIATAARQALGPLGLVRKGRSRLWIDDHGWWLINVEFQPSGYSTGCYLNVGEQHLWVARDRLCLENFERPLGGSSVIAFTGDERAFTAAMQSVVDAAVDAVTRRREKHADGVEALRRLARGDDDLNAGIASAVLGDQDTARGRLSGGVHDAHREDAEQYIGLPADKARERAWRAVERTRMVLGLLPTHRPSWSA